MKMLSDVLIVEDDTDLMEVVELLLRNAGYATRTALNGQQALEAVHEAMPGMILLDMIMPVMDGLQFADAFHTRYGSAVPIVALTAADEARNRCRTIEAADVLTKPFDAAELLRVVARHVAPSRQQSGYDSTL